MQRHREGAVQFTLVNEAGWDTDDKVYEWPVIESGTVKYKVLKRSDRTLEIRIKAPYADEIVFETGMPKVKPYGLGVVLRWSEDDGMRLSLAGKFVESRPLSIA